MDVIYVDLNLTDSGYAGTTASPYSWSDVKTYLTSVADTASNSASPAALNLAFKLRGTGDVLTQSGAIALSNMYLSANSSLEFSAWDPWAYGLPVLRAPVTSDLGADISKTPWLSIKNSTQVNLSTSGIVFGLNLPLVSSGVPIISIDNPVLGSCVFKNNVLAISGYGNRIVSITGATQDYHASAAHNTIVYGSAAQADSFEVIRCIGGTLYAGLNAVLQHATSQAVVTFVANAYKLYTNANAFGLRASSILYGGSTTQNSYSPDIAGVQLTQGICGPYQLVSTNEDPVWSQPAGIPLLQASAFWPVQASKLLNIGKLTVPATIDLQASVTDAAGLDRPAGALDAGAFQKTQITYAQSVHVNLSGAADNTGSGSDSDPISVNDFLRDYTRRSPVDYALTYVLRNANDQAVSLLDFGPIGWDSSRYTGAGTIDIIGYKTYAYELPVLKIARIQPNASLPVKVSKLKIDYVGLNSNNALIAPTVTAASSFAIVNSVIRSEASASGYIVESGVGAGPINFRGCSIHIGHTSGTSTGVFKYPSTDTASDISLCAINLDNNVVMGSGNVAVRACYVSTGTGSAATFTGAAIDAYTELNGTNAFKNPTATLLVDADFTLIDGSGAIGRAPFASALGNAAADLLTDCRVLTRNAYPNGDTRLDAGAYETNVYVPDNINKYVDFAKTSTGTGKPGDRWCPQDLQAWITSLAGSVLTQKVQINAVRTGEFELEITGLEADANGGFLFTSEQLNNPSLWSTSAFENVYLHDCVGITVDFTRVLLRNTSGCPVLSVKDSAACTANIMSSILDVKRGALAWSLTVSSSWSGTGSVTITTATATLIPLSTGSGTAGAAAIANALSAYVRVRQHGSRITITADAGTAIALTGTGLTLTQLINDVDVSGALTVVGSSFNSEFTTELGVVTQILKSDATKAYYSAFQGHLYSSTSKTGDIAGAGDVQWCGINQATATAGLHCITPSNQLFTMLRAVDTDTDAFALSGTELVGIVASSDAHTVTTASGYNTDIFGHLRSQEFVGGAAKFDAGAVESSYLDQNSHFDGTPEDVTTYVTDIGYSMNSRALAGNIQFQLVGYACSNSGYCYWAPEKLALSGDAGKQAYTVLTASPSVVWTNVAVTVTTSLETITITCGSDFSIGATAEATLQNIAAALQASSHFAQACWCLVENNSLRVSNHRFGAITPPAIAAHDATTSSNIIGITVAASVPGVEITGVANQVYPASGYAAWGAVEVPYERARSFVMRIGENEGNFMFGEVYVIGEVTASPFPNEVGNLFPYAVSVSPISAKHNRKIAIKRIIFSY